jgi:thiol-disulfide isomerase/thioredoxin
MSESTLYYFYSVGCGWCKKTEPLVDELNEAGYDILKLDLADKDNQELNKQLKEKYKKQCGTPWLIDAESGNNICGFREKDIIEKWAKGEEIPEPPKPKSPPPPPPQDFDNEEQVKTWTEGYEKWVKENDHMPNLPPGDQMLGRLKQQKAMFEQRQAQQAGNLPPAAPGAPAVPTTSIPPSIPTSMGDTGNVIVDNRLQILESKQNILEVKLDQIINTLTKSVEPKVQPTIQPKQPVVKPQPKGLPGPPASKKPPKKKRNKK